MYKWQKKWKVSYFWLKGLDKLMVCWLDHFASQFFILYQYEASKEINELVKYMIVTISYKVICITWFSHTHHVFTHFCKSSRMVVLRWCIWEILRNIWFTSASGITWRWGKAEGGGRRGRESEGKRTRRWEWIEGKRKHSHSVSKYQCSVGSIPRCFVH